MAFGFLVVFIADRVIVFEGNRLPLDANSPWPVNSIPKNPGGTFFYLVFRTKGGIHRLKWPFCCQFLIQVRANRRKPSPENLSEIRHGGNSIIPIQAELPLVDYTVSPKIPREGRPRCGVVRHPSSLGQLGELRVGSRLRPVHPFVDRRYSAGEFFGSPRKPPSGLKPLRFPTPSTQSRSRPCLTIRTRIRMPTIPPTRAQRSLALRSRALPRHSNPARRNRPHRRPMHPKRNRLPRNRLRIPPSKVA